MSMGFPPFTRVIKWLIISNAVIYLLMLILGGVAPHAAALIQGYGGLVPALVAQLHDRRSRERLGDRGHPVEGGVGGGARGGGGAEPDPCRPGQVVAVHDRDRRAR
jgi:hypothetical protein